MDASHDRMLISFKPGFPEKQRLQLHKQMGVALVGQISKLHIHIVKIDITQTKSCMSSYGACKGVQYIERDKIVKKHFVPNDRLFPQQWGLNKIAAPQAWNITKGLPTIRVAVLDTGVAFNHPDITPKVVINANFSMSSTANDLDGHGTHVAGIISAVTNNTIGVAGVGFQTAIMNVKVLDDEGSGFLSDIARGIVFAANRGARVINMSLGGGFSDSTLQKAVQYATNKGVLLVASAGNDGTNEVNFPAGLPNVLSVAATTRNDVRAPFSNYGAAWVDMAAPGVSILSTLPTQPNNMEQRNYGYLSGTSMSAPFVSGLAALMLAVNPRLTPPALTNILGITSDRVTGYGTLYKYGRINAFRAVARIKGQK